MAHNKKFKMREGYELAGWITIVFLLVVGVFLFI